MNFFKEWGRFMMMGAKAYAQWEIEMSNNIMRDRKRLVILGLLMIPVVLGGIAFADQAAKKHTALHFSQPASLFLRF